MSSFKINPYRPGAGTNPAYLAGRENELDMADTTFQALRLQIPVQSIIYTGLRGVGKTVLLNQMEELAKKKSIECRHIEVENRNDFISQIITCCQVFLRNISTGERMKQTISKAVDALKSLAVSFSPESNTFSLSMQEQDLYKTTNLTQSLTDVFVSVGEAARDADKPICFFIDEMQYMKGNELSSLIAALHRANQLNLPIMIVGAGLPKLYKMLAEEKTYTERLFLYHEIGSLSEEDATKAITEPLRLLGVNYSRGALKKIYKTTKGYPFFIQQLCKEVYSLSEGKLIEEKDVEKGIVQYYSVLDSGFFKSRYERCSETDKYFIFAMVACGNLPCTIANVAKNLGKSVTSISTTRAQLISKGIVYSAKYSELDFTVPDFDDFIRRNPEYEEWLKNK